MHLLLSTLLFLILLSISVIHSYPGEIIQGCIPSNKSWTEDYAPWSNKAGEDHHRYAYVHLTFDDGPELVDTPIILDILLEYNIKATFFIITNKINNETIPILERMLVEGHAIGSHSYSHKNLLYSNDELMRQEIDYATDNLTNLLGERPKLYRPAYGAIDNRSYEYLKQEGYSIVLWSGGCSDWYYDSINMTIDDEESLDMATKSILYTSAGEGAIFCLHDYSQSGRIYHNGAYLRSIIDAMYNGVNFVDLETCLGRKDVDENDQQYVDKDDKNVLNLNGYGVGGWIVLILLIFVLLFLVFLCGAYCMHRRYKQIQDNKDGMMDNLEMGTTQQTAIIPQHEK